MRIPRDVGPNAPSRDANGTEAGEAIRRWDKDNKVEKRTLFEFF